MGEVRDDAMARALQAAEARFRDLIDRNADGVVVVDQEGMIRYVNPAAEDVLGRTSGTLMGQPFGTPLIPGETTEIDLPRADGSFRVAEMRVARSEWQGQGAMFCTIRDVTDRLATEETLFLRQREFRLLIENAPDPIIRFGRDLRVRFVNPATLRTLRAPLHDLMGRPLAQLPLPRELLDFLATSLRDAFNSGEERVIEFDAPGRLQTRHFHGRIVPERDPYDVIETVLLVARDISNRKRLEIELQKRIEALAEADRRKDEFLAMLSHELRNPLTPILNATQVLQLRSDPVTRESMRRMIEQQARHMARLVDDLLNVSRIKHGKVRLQREVVDLAQCVRNAHEVVRPNLDRQRHTLHMALPEGPLWVDADPSRLEQVLVNLLSNAIKYTPPGGTVRVALEEVEGEAVFRVRDNGIGIDPEWLPRVFDLFSQADTSLAHSQGGLGIGLTLVKTMVELHGGTVSAHSVGRGQGSEFVVRLPALERAATALPAPSGNGHGRPSDRASRVLVVDDNMAGNQSLMMLIELWGHQATAAHDGPEALAMAARLRPDVVLLDIGLPGMDGYQVAGELRRHEATRDALLIAMTGYGQEEDRRRSLAAGFDHHLVKPVDLEHLEDLLAEVSLNRPQVEAAN